MIKKAGIKDSKYIFDLIRKVYKKHSLLKLGLADYKKLLKEELYLSFIYKKGSIIIAHGGVLINKLENFGIITALIVDPRFRKKGIGKKIFKKRIEICKREGLDYIVGYSMMQHLNSQKLYDHSFIPVGMCVGYPDIYQKRDYKYNKGKSNAEMILCKKLNKKIKIIDVKCPKELYKEVNNILKTIGAKANLIDSNKNMNNKIFLGLNPSIFGFGEICLMNKKIKPNFDLMLTNMNDRKVFKNKIKKEWERR